MVFSSITFLFLFLPIVLAVYYIVPGKAKNIIVVQHIGINASQAEPFYAGNSRSFFYQFHQTGTAVGTVAGQADGSKHYFFVARFC